MNLEQAREIIDALERRHKAFKLTGFNVTNNDMFMTFEPINLSLNTIYNWITDAGGKAVMLGTEGTGDNVVMYARVRLP